MEEIEEYGNEENMEEDQDARPDLRKPKDDAGPREAAVESEAARAAGPFSL